MSKIRSISFEESSIRGVERKYETWLEDTQNEQGKYGLRLSIISTTHSALLTTNQFQQHFMVVTYCLFDPAQPNR